eukprot:7033448-Pyramimonas_sp.AAC.1
MRDLVRATHVPTLVQTTFVLSRRSPGRPHNHNAWIPLLPQASLRVWSDQNLEANPAVATRAPQAAQEGGNEARVAIS